MKNTPLFLAKHVNNTALVEKIIGFLCIAGLLITYLSHLGYIPLQTDSDEARRALVTAEMMISGDYVSPTVNGEIFLNKPPLYNYLIAGYFKLFGDYSMFAFRLQVVVAIALTGLLTYFFVKKYTDHRVAFFAAFAYMTNGRILIYDSLYGFIDTTFALTAYANIMLIFYFGEKRKYAALFISSYIMCALGFLLKGLPSVVFQGISLIVYFILNKDLRKLFSMAHFYGLLAFMILTGSYYVIYFTENSFSPLILFNNLLEESTKRTFVQFGFWATVKHFFSFPFEMFYHFLPWSIFVVALFTKKFKSIIAENKFIKYNAIAFIANIPVYWLSVEVNPRYIFMLVPLFFTVVFYFYFNHLQQDAWQRKLLNIVIYVCCIGIALGGVIFPFTHYLDGIDNVFLKSITLIAGSFLCFYMIIRNKFVMHFFLVALILLRAGFNWFVLEQRGKNFFQAEAWGKQIADITRNNKLFILKGADTDNFDGMSFHVCIWRNEILKNKNTIIPGAYYIVDNNQLKQNQFAIDMHFINFPYNKSLYLVHTTQ